MSLGLSVHVGPSLRLVFLAVRLPAIREGKLIEAFDKAGLRVWDDGLGLVRIGLLRHTGIWQVQSMVRRARNLKSEFREETRRRATKFKKRQLLIRPGPILGNGVRPECLWCSDIN